MKVKYFNNFKNNKYLVISNGIFNGIVDKYKKKYQSI